MSFIFFFTGGLHLKPSEKSLQEYSGTKNSAFEKDVKRAVEILYGPSATKTSWVVKDIRLELCKDTAFWKRWNHLDHLFATEAQLNGYIQDLKGKKIPRMDDSVADVEE
jgi:hypothetical protein